MMKFHYLLSLAAGALMVVPPIAFRAQEGEGEDSLKRALSRTLAAIDELAGVQEQIARGDRAGIVSILSATEKAAGEPRQRDEFLATLREEVSGLQMVLDEERAGTTPSILSYSSFGLGPDPLHSTSPRSTGGSTSPVGLSGDWRDSLSLGGAPGGRGEARRPTSSAGAGLEQDGFSADPLREGKLLARAGRHQDAIRALMPIQEQPEASYWIARSLQRLDRDQEARELLRRLVADESAGIHGRRAQRDLDFLDVKAKLQQRRRALEERQ